MKISRTAKQKQTETDHEEQQGRIENINRGGIIEAKSKLRKEG